MILKIFFRFYALLIWQLCWGHSIWKFWLIRLQSWVSYLWLSIDTEFYQVCVVWWFKYVYKINIIPKFIQLTTTKHKRKLRVFKLYTQQFYVKFFTSLCLTWSENNFFYPWVIEGDFIWKISTDMQHSTTTRIIFLL